MPKPKEMGLSEPVEATVVVSEPSEDAAYEANLYSPRAHELEALEAHSCKCLDLNHLSPDPRQPETSHGVALPPQQSEPSVETQPSQPLIQEPKPVLQSVACTSKPSRSKAVGSVKEATLKLLPTRRKKKGSSKDMQQETGRPLSALPHQQLLDWGRACGFSFSEDIAKEVVSTLLELEREKASVAAA